MCECVNMKEARMQVAISGYLNHHQSSAPIRTEPGGVASTSGRLFFFEVALLMMMMMSPDRSTLRRFYPDMGWQMADWPGSIVFPTAESNADEMGKSFCFLCFLPLGWQSPQQMDVPAACNGARSKRIATGVLPILAPVTLSLSGGSSTPPFDSTTHVH